MRTLLWVILALAVLVAGVTGFGRAARYDARLVAADSLMHDAPDSALAIVQAVSPVSLAGEGDRAYRGLLLTQARYRCYVTATGDSAINRALAYYRRHGGEREKLTRAYIYKGAVMEELGHPDSAMLYYKHAEATAAPDDHFNLGQINTRIAALYRRYYADSQKCFERYDHAYYYYTLTGNKRMQLNSLYNMVMMNGITRQNDQRTLFENAVNLATELLDSLQLFELWEIRCRQLSRNGSTWRQGKMIALNCLHNYKHFVNNDLLIDLAHLYVWDNKPDSARFFLESVNEEPDSAENQRIKSRKSEVLAMLSNVGSGQESASGSPDGKASDISDSILNRKDRYSIERIENHFQLMEKLKQDRYIHLLNMALKFLLVLTAIPAAILFSRHYYKMKRIHSIMDELRKTSIDEHESLISQLDARTADIARLVKNLVELMKTGIDAGMATSSSTIAKRIKETIVDVADDNFWKELRRYLDDKYHGMITNMAYRHGFKEKDLRFIELCCCGFSNSEIALIMDYSQKYISNKRRNITRKIGIGTPLQDYLNTMMNENR